MTLRLGSKIIPTISFYKTTGVVPQGVFEVPSRIGTYDVKSYAFARAEFEDNLEKRLNGTLSYYSNSTASSIATYAFAGANITGVSLPNVTKMSSYAFAYCESLTSINLPKLLSTSSYAFLQCSNLASFSFPSCSLIAEGTFKSCIGLPSNLVLASNFKTISGGAFAYCPNLQTVQCLGATSVRGFSNCDNLITLSLPVCLSIGNCSYMTKLQNLYAPSLTTIDGWGLGYCYSLQTFSCSNVSYIGGYGMASCSSLLSLSLSLATTIDAYALVDCQQLRTVSFPLLSVLRNGVFQRCYNLQTVNIPSCTQIYDYAFYCCSSLTTLSVPLCSFIGNYAFYNCLSFSTLYLASNSVAVLSGANVFSYTQIYYSSKYGSIFVPASLVNAYKSATN